MILIAITKVKSRVVSWSYILTQDFVFILRPTIFSLCLTLVTIQKNM